MTNLQSFQRRLLVAAVASLALAPQVAAAQFTLDVYLPLSQAGYYQTWIQPVPAHFSWWDMPDPSQPSAVDCSYNAYVPISGGADLYSSINAIHCLAGTSQYAGYHPGIFQLQHYASYVYSEYDTPTWMASLAFGAYSGPTWPNMISYQLGSIAFAGARFNDTSDPVQFMTLNTFVTRDANGGEIMNYQFADPVVLPEPTSSMLVATGLLVVAAATTRRRRVVR